MFLIYLMACSEYSLGNADDAYLKITPFFHDFGSLSYKEDPFSQTFLVENVGNANINIDDFFIGDGFSIYNFPDFLNGNESAEFTVSFDPNKDHQYVSNVFVAYNGSPSKSFSSIKGRGLAPKLSVAYETDEIHGEAFCESYQDVVISNIGSMDLNIFDLDVYVSFPSNLNIDLTDLPFNYPWVISPGQSYEINITSDNSDLITDETQILVASDDPETPYKQAELKFSTYSDDWTQDSFEQEEFDSADILFVIDNSGSMSEEQSILANNFQNFVGSLANSSVDFQIGFITTDSAEFEGEILNHNTPDIEAEFIAQAQVGTGGSALEKPLKYSKLATQSGGDAVPLVRPDSVLSIVIITDENDSSEESDQNYTNHFQSLNNKGTKIHSIVSAPPNGCSGNQINERLVGISYQTGGAVMSICSQDWGADLEEIALQSVLQSKFMLSKEAIAGTITVTVDGVSENNWVFDPNINSVIFNSNYIPQPEQEIVIDYAFVAECY